MRTELVTIVVPAYNEEHNVTALYAGVRAHLQSVALEIIFIDDGSCDRTSERIGELARTDPDVQLIRFSRNFGHQAALLAGLRAARGDAVITMDCDLQHPPELLPSMVEAWRSGALIVQMSRCDTKGASLFKKFTSRMYYALMSILSDQPVTLGPDFQLIDRKVLKAVLSFRDSRPFLRGTVAWVGFPKQRIGFVAPERQRGTSGFSLLRMCRMALDGIAGLSTKPLRLAALFGCLTALCCLSYALVVVIAWMRGAAIHGWPSIIITILFLGSVQLISIGILGEYIGRIYEITRGVPPYIIQTESRVGAMGENLSIGAETCK